MKDKKVLMLLFLVILMLLLGIGYALTDTKLVINGNTSATANLDDNFKVRFKKNASDNAYEEPTAGTNATGEVTSDLEATMNVSGLNTVGDEAKLTFAVENYSQGIDASVTANAEVLTNSEYFSVKTEDITNTATVIEPGKENFKTVTVVVTLNKTPIADQTGTVKVTLTAEPKAK